MRSLNWFVFPAVLLLLVVAGCGSPDTNSTKDPQPVELEKLPGKKPVPPAPSRQP